MSEAGGEEIVMNPDELFREEIFTDRRVGTIQRLTPVDGNGDVDPSRTVQFIGQASLMTPAGSLPISFEIEASTIGEAAGKFGDLAAEAVQDAVRQLQEMRREAASGLIVPGQGGMPGGGMPGGGNPGGGLPGGGIQLR